LPANKKNKKFRIFKNFSKKSVEENIHNFIDEPKKIIKSSVNLISKSIFIFLVFSIIVIGYLIALVSSEPKNFKFVDELFRKEIIKQTSKNQLPFDIGFNKSYVSFTRYGMIKITIDKFAIKNSYISAITSPQYDNIKSVEIPKLDLQFSILQLLMKNFIPNSLKIADSKINILNKITENTANQPDSNISRNYYKLAIDQLKNLVIAGMPLRHLQLENIDIILEDSLSTLNYEVSAPPILSIKKFELRTKFENKIFNFDGFGLVISSHDSFIAKELNFDWKCNFIDLKSLKCEASSLNIDVSKIIKNLINKYPIVNNIKDLSGFFSLKALFTIDDSKLSDIILKANSFSSKINFDNFFENPLNLHNLNIEAKYGYENKVFEINNFSADIVDPKLQEKYSHLEGLQNQDSQELIKINNIENKVNKNLQDQNFELIKFRKAGSNQQDLLNNFAHIDAKTSMKQYNNLKTLDLSIVLKNCSRNYLEYLWPIGLGNNNLAIRNWASQHIDKLKMPDANLLMSFSIKNGEPRLDNLDASFNFENLDLKYHDKFPKVVNAIGKAHFTKKSMDIVVNNAEIAGSKASNVLVAIKDFFADDLFLDINGYSEGKAVDLLDYIPQSEESHKNISRYLAGEAKTKVSLRIPIDENAGFIGTNLNISSIVSNLKNQYLNNRLAINIIKKIGENIIFVKSDLGQAKINLPIFGIDKSLNESAGISFAIDLNNSSNIKIDQFEFWKSLKKINNNFNIDNLESEIAKNNLYAEGAKNKIIGGVSLKKERNNALENSSFKIISLNLKNKNFGKNNFDLSYQNESKNNVQKINLTGQIFDLSEFLNYRQNKSGNWQNFIIKTNLKKLILNNQKALDKVDISINCSNYFCEDGKIEASISDEKNVLDKAIDIKIIKQDSENIAIKGKINNLGYLAEALNISDKIGDGSIDIDISGNGQGLNPNFKGNINLEKSITFYESKQIKDLAKDNLFSKIKDKIFANNKVIFNFAKVDFAIENKILKIKSLVANNYKIGITAKGFCNLKDNSFEIKGMIIPAFIINNLFGVDKIPVIGNLIGGILTGGEGGGLFGIKYEYIKNSNQNYPIFTTYKVSAFIPTTINTLFEKI
jgi:hypothetical protein